MQILQSLTESMNYFYEDYSIRKLIDILVNFTDNIIIKTTVWENQCVTLLPGYVKNLNWLMGKSVWNKSEAYMIFVTSKLALVSAFNPCPAE